MNIISYKKGENEGALFIHDEKNYSACTAVEQKIQNSQRCNSLVECKGV
jgi:hypothetical protein